MKNASRRIYVAVGWMMLSVASVSAQNGWYEDFEHYAAGAFLRRIGPSAETPISGSIITSVHPEISLSGFMVPWAVAGGRYSIVP